MRTIRTLLNLLSKPYKTWAKAYDKSMSETRDMEEPGRSILLTLIMNGEN